MAEESGRSAVQDTPSAAVPNEDASSGSSPPSSSAQQNETFDDPKRSKTKPTDKIKVHFVAVGSAPLMKKTKFSIGADQRFAAVATFLRKMLKLNETGSSLFLYCSSCFVPSPDELLAELNDAFSVRGELVIHYSLQEAWG
jgi:ubiquitin-like protein ATG12